MADITAETVAAAERLAAVEYTPAERAQMLGKLDEHVGRARARRAFEPANGLGPAVVFDPRLPGVALAPNDGGFQPSEPASTFGQNQSVGTPSSDTAWSVSSTCPSDSSYSVVTGCWRTTM